MSEGRVRPTGPGPTVALSIRALQYAQQFHADNESALAGRLYRFNCLPASPRWLRRLPSPIALRERLDLARAATTTETHAVWRRSGLSPEHGGWILWQRNERHFADRRDFRFKLYLSPTPEELLAQFSSIIHALGETDALAVKLGDTAYGLLRPDKLVAYFRNRGSLQSAARQLSPSFAGMSAHGVPFTASLSENGMLSWGVDPLTNGEDGLQQRESWRGWVTRRLAQALVQARRDTESGVTPWQYALDQLSLAGIDTTTFAPTSPGWVGDEAV